MNASTEGTEEKAAMSLYPHEVEAILKTPDALELLADWHENQLTMADAINDEGIYDGVIKYHDARKKELLTEAARLRAEM